MATKKSSTTASEDFVLSDISSTLDTDPNKSDYILLVEKLVALQNGRPESDIPVGEDYWKVKAEVMASTGERKG